MGVAREKCGYGIICLLVGVFIAFAIGILITLALSECWLPPANRRSQCRHCYTFFT